MKNEHRWSRAKKFQTKNAFSTAYNMLGKVAEIFKENVRMTI